MHTCAHACPCAYAHTGTRAYSHVSLYKAHVYINAHVCRFTHLCTHIHTQGQRAHVHAFIQPTRAHPCTLGHARHAHSVRSRAGPVATSQNGLQSRMVVHGDNAQPRWQIKDIPPPKVCTSYSSHTSGVSLSEKVKPFLDFLPPSRAWCPAPFYMVLCFLPLLLPDWPHGVLKLTRGACHPSKE